MPPSSKRIAGYTVSLYLDPHGSRVAVERENTREIKVAWNHYDDVNGATFAYNNIKSFSGIKNFVRKAESSRWDMKLSANN